MPYRPERRTGTTSDPTTVVLSGPLLAGALFYAAVVSSVSNGPPKPKV